MSRSSNFQLSDQLLVRTKRKRSMSFHRDKDDDASTSTSLGSESTNILQENLTSKASSEEEPLAKLRSSNMTAFVTLLKALFGVSLLSSPRVLGETGLILGTLVYIAIVSACVGSCWCLLQARAKISSDAAQGPPLSDSPATSSAAITYGDLGRKLLGTRASFMINVLIVSLHICFGAGLVDTSIHQISVILGWEQDSDENGEEEIWLAGRALLAALFFPVIALLLQFKSLQDLFWICLAGIVVFLVGCVGTMLYSSVLSDNGGNEDDAVSNSNWDIPTDALEWKWSGIPNFVASTLCAMEGINLALPIANIFYLTSNNNSGLLQSLESRSPIPVVMAAVGAFGVITLVVAFFGYMSGLGGGSGTRHDDQNDDTEDCRFVAHCLDSALLETIHRVSLAAALIFTLPIILYPSLEILERWAEQRRRPLKTGKTLFDSTLDDSWNGFVCIAPSDSWRRQMDLEENIFGTEPFFPCLHRHWRYRISHAAAVCLIAIADRPWERGLVLFKGIGLSVACFVLPVILFVRAHSLAVVLQKPALSVALGGLISLGLVNFVLVILSVFTEHNFMPTEIHDDPLHHHHESHSGDQ